MTEATKENGLMYATKILQDEWQPTLIYWLGFRPFNMAELVQLLPDLSEEQLTSTLHDLQNLRVVNPICDTENRYSLTDDGEQLRHLMIPASVWGVQQQDDNADRQSMQIVEPEMDASMKDLVKYTDTVKKYL